MATRLTMRRLEAIIEALTSRLAGDLDIAGETDTPAAEDYEKALDWAAEELAKRREFNAKLGIT